MKALFPWYFNDTERGQWNLLGKKKGQSHFNNFSLDCIKEWSFYFHFGLKAVIKKKIQSVCLDSGQSIDFSCLIENKEDNY